MSKAYTVARTNLNGKNFEIIVKPDPALLYRKGSITSLSDVLITETIFSDANKGLKVSEKDLEESFHTIEVRKIIDYIIRKGTLNLTAEQRKRMINEKRNQIVTFIKRQAVDPRTKLPHPAARIENALEQIRFSVDPFEDIEKQSNKAIDQIRSILPLSIEKISVSVEIPSQYVGRSYGTIKLFGVIKSEKWKNDGALSAVIEMPAGLYGSFLEKIGDITRGNAQAGVLK